MADEMEVAGETVGETKQESFLDEDEQEGKSLDELAGEGHIATPDTNDEHGTMEVEINKEPPTTKGQVTKPHTEASEGKRRMGELVEDIAQATKNAAEAIEAGAPMTEAEIMKPVDFKDGIFGMRGDIELVKSKCKNWLSHPAIQVARIELKPLSNREEMVDNLKLAYRALENARMRLGKAVQAYDGGKSCYPR